MPSLRELMAQKAAAGQQPAAATPKCSGLKLSDPSATEPGELQPLSKQTVGQGRPLQSTKAHGDAIPLDYPSENASPDEKLWWQARHSLDLDLAIWIEPESNHAWLAVAPPSKQVAPLILLQRLPLANNPRPGDPF
jgi:hypothetical protein